MLYKHINNSRGTFAIVDSKGNFHSLKPGQELIIDKNNEYGTLISIEKIKKVKKLKEVKENDSSS